MVVIGHGRLQSSVPIRRKQATIEKLGGNQANSW